MRRNFSTRLKQSEWDFSKVRDEELHICAWWEYLKEIDEAVRAVEAERFRFHHNKQLTRKQWEDSGFTQGDLSRHDCLPFSFAQDAEWPNVPWNELPKERRRQIVGRYPAQSMHYDYWNISAELIPDLRRIGDHLEDVEQAVKRKWIPGRVRIYGTDEPPVDVEFVLHQIDWSMANEKLVHIFEDWIKKHRPADAQPEESRGSASNIRRLRTLLKHLGVWRLLREMEWTEAADHTAEYSREFLPKPLISDYPHTWQRAFKSAEKKIESLRRRLTIEPWFPVDHYWLRAEMLNK